MPAEVESIDLSMLKPVGPLVFQRVEWWRKSSRFVLVRYSYGGIEPEFGLRLDLDKRVFLDHPDDPNFDKIIQEYAKIIWEIVAGTRSHAGASDA
jgi:hypothetical protein